MALTKIPTLQKVIGQSRYLTTLGEANDMVIIGKDTDPLTQLSPKIEFSKWNNEEKLSIEYEGMSAATPTVTNGIITTGNAKEGFYIHRYSDDTLKFGLILHSIPDKSKIVTIDGIEYYQWQFKLTGWENFDFFYQPPLTQKEINEGSIRPDDVVGSYAVYHKTKKNHVIGETNYQTGKIGHDYRPKFIDAQGKTEWAILQYDKGIRTVSISKDFLDNAVYPVKANDTYGSTVIGATDASMATKDTSLNVSGTMPANGTITAISYYLRFSTANKTAKVNYFGNDNNKSTGADSERTDIGNTDNNQHQYDFTISGDTENVGDKCAVGVKFNGFSPVLKYDATTGTANAWVNASYYTYADAIPSTRETANAQERQYSVWLTYTPSGGGGGVLQRRRITISYMD